MDFYRRAVARPLFSFAFEAKAMEPFVLFAPLRGLSSDMKRDLALFHVQNHVSLRVFDPRSRYVGNGTHVHQPKLQLDALLVPIALPALMEQRRHTIVAVTEKSNPTENRNNPTNPSNIRLYSTEEQIFVCASFFAHFAQNRPIRGTFHTPK